MLRVQTPPHDLFGFCLAQGARPYKETSLSCLHSGTTASCGTSPSCSVSNVVTCSDASEAGGGLCSSGGLTTEGEQYQEDRYTSFMPQGAMRSYTKKGIRIAVISLFDGISALMCALAACNAGLWPLLPAKPTESVRSL